MYYGICEEMRVYNGNWWETKVYSAIFLVKESHGGVEIWRRVG